MMKQTNSIIDLFGNVIQNQRMVPSHISLYVALFQLWSLHKFQNPFRVCRTDIMKLGKIKSYATYHKCIKELHHAGFIIYSPSYNPYEGSSIEILDFDRESSDQNKILQDAKILPPIECCFSVPMFCEVEMYFHERDLQSAEADQFYSLYQSKNWKLSNDKPMKSWHSAARNWISEFKKIQNNINEIYRP